MPERPLTFRLRKSIAPQVKSTFIPEQHYVNGDANLYFKQPTRKRISEVWNRAYYAWRERSSERHPVRKINL